MDVRRLALALAVWLVPVGLVWIALTPFYNRFLVVSAENFLHLFESPDETDLFLAVEDDDHARIARLDFPPAKRNVSSLRVTDVHFHLLLLAALFLAVPGIGWRLRLENLGWALLIAVFFHIFLVAAWVKFVYATQLGDFSLEHYGPLARNVYGLGKHLLDLPFKLAFPLAVWAAFYGGRLLPKDRPG